MRRELDDSFRTAHSEVARIIAELQRQPSSQRAASARERLETLREQTAQVHSEQFESESQRAPELAASTSASDAQPIDWPKARVGDAVALPGGGPGTLLSLPDRKGRVSVQVAGAKVNVAREDLRRSAGGASAAGEARRAPRPRRSKPSRSSGSAARRSSIYAACASRRPSTG